MFKGGRLSHPIWEYFLRVKLTVDGKFNDKCKICVQQQLPHAERMISHNSLCATLHNQSTYCYNAASTNIIQKKPRSPYLTVIHRRNILCPANQISAAYHKKKSSGSTARSTLIIEIAKMFFACNIPFSLTEHPQFCRIIQPGYTPPSHKAIGGILLDNVHDQLTQDGRDSVSGETATLVQVGWSNIHNEPIVASCLQVDNKSFQLDSCDTGSMTKSVKTARLSHRNPSK